MSRKRVGILISGRGSNMEALITAARDPAYPAEIVAVVSNVPGAGGLAKAEAAGIPALTIDHRAFPSRTAFELRMHKALLDHGVELVCNAGFMRLLTADFVNRWLDRHLNIHPSLLPAFPGLETHERVLASGTRITGASVHFVRVEMDNGPIVAQAAVPVRSFDSPETLATRVLAAEHRLYPHALALVARGDIRVVNGTIIIDNEPAAAFPLYSPALGVRSSSAPPVAQVDMPMAERVLTPSSHTGERRS